MKQTRLARVCKYVSMCIYRRLNQPLHFYVYIYMYNMYAPFRSVCFLRDGAVQCSANKQTNNTLSHTLKATARYRWNERKEAHTCTRIEIAKPRNPAPERSPPKVARSEYMVRGGGRFSLAVHEPTTEH